MGADRLIDRVESGEVTLRGIRAREQHDRDVPGDVEVTARVGDPDKVIVIRAEGCAAASHL